MKTRRHAKILELINEHSVDTQEDCCGSFGRMDLM